MISFAVLDQTPDSVRVSNKYTSIRAALRELKIGQALRVTGFKDVKERLQWKRGLTSGSPTSDAFKLQCAAEGWRITAFKADEGGELVVYVIKEAA